MSSNVEWEVEKKSYFDKIRTWVRLNIESDSSAAAFALADVLEMFIAECDLTEVQRGAMVSDITGTLRLRNKIQLALYDDYKKTVKEGKQSTKH